VPKSWITDEMRGSIGQVLRERVSFPISASDIRKWAQAVYYPEPPPAYYWDLTVAKKHFGRLAAPEEFNPFAWMTVDGPPTAKADSPEARVHPEIGLGVAPPGTTGRLNGGKVAEYSGVRMCEDDVITAITTLDDYVEREGRLGLMLFTISKQTWTNGEGEVIKVQRDTLIRY
jgi:hypothetical protein